MGVREMDRARVREVPETHPASRVYRIFTGMFVFGPPALLAASFRKRWFLASPANRRIFGVSYLLSGFGITAGYHRLFTHRSFRTYPLIRVVFAVLGSTAIQGSVPDWVADHRKHHAYADEAGDPRRPSGRPDTGLSPCALRLAACRREGIAAPLRPGSAR
jgi:stearoyl-CoA desaturase (delta-9 desaturase)